MININQNHGGGNPTFVLVLYGIMKILLQWGNRMRDQDFLEKVVSSAAFLSEAMPKQMIGIKDINSEHIFCSDYLAALMGIKPTQLAGKKVWLHLYDNDANFEEIIVAEDQTIIKSRESKLALKINKFHTGLLPYTCIKTPLINPKTNHVVGLLFQGFEIGTMLLKKNAIKVTVSEKNHAKSSALPKLTKREKQVIFFFMANLSSQEIAEMIYKMEGKKIAKSTIDSLFNDQLYAKFDVYSRPALYKKLQALGYDQLTPKELLSATSKLLDVMRVY